MYKKRGLSIDGLKKYPYNLPEGQTPEPCNNHVLDMYTQSHLAKKYLQAPTQRKSKQASSWCC